MHRDPSALVLGRASGAADSHIPRKETGLIGNEAARASAAARCAHSPSMPHRGSKVDTFARRSKSSRSAFVTHFGVATVTSK